MVCVWCVYYTYHSWMYACLLLHFADQMNILSTLPCFFSFCHASLCIANQTKAFLDLGRGSQGCLMSFSPCLEFQCSLWFCPFLCCCFCTCICYRQSVKKGISWSGEKLYAMHVMPKFCRQYEYCLKNSAWDFTVCLTANFCIQANRVLILCLCACVWRDDESEHQ